MEEINLMFAGKSGNGWQVVEGESTSLFRDLSREQSLDVIDIA